MTKIKLCGLQNLSDVIAANAVQPDYIGFVFAQNSRRYVEPRKAMALRKRLAGRIEAVGVFVDAPVEDLVMLLNKGTIDIAQLHGSEDEEYINVLRKRTDKKIIKAFRIETMKNLQNAEHCTADYILLDSGGGTGKCFDWNLLQGFKRPYFLAGGLGCDNIAEVVCQLCPYAVDVSSGIETDGKKDYKKMLAFTNAVRNKL